MQVKKFEAPTIQEALDTIKRELGPEAIILQTKKLKKGFGLMSKESVEVTAAVSERSMQKKTFTEKRLPEPKREAVKKLPASKQGDIYDKYMAKHEARAVATRDRVELSGKISAHAQNSAKRLTATRYADIDSEELPAPPPAVTRAAAAPRGVAGSPAVRGASQAQTLHDVAEGRIAAAGAVLAPVGSGMSVEEELRHLKRMIEEMKNVQESSDGSSGVMAGNHNAFGTPALQDAFDQLLLGGVDKRYALGLIKKTAFEIGEERSANPEYVLDQLAVEVMQTTAVLSPLASIKSGAKAPGEGPTIIALVGPTGVGKTTTVAKLASDALLKRGLKVGLISLDSYRVAAFDQLATYAKILNVPFRSVANADDLKVAVQDFNAMDLVLVDTTGHSQRDPASLKEMRDILGCVPGLSSELVLSVTTRDSELYDMANRFLIFRPQGIIISKLDEASMYGAIYNVSQKAKLPLLYFTTGQRVPEDLEESTRERVAALIMDI